MSDDSESTDVYTVPDGDGGTHTVVRESSSFRCTDCGEEYAIPMGFDGVECNG